MQPPAKQLPWNDREARSVIPAAACDPNAEPTQEDGCRLTWDFGVRRQGSSPEPVD
jgi:hypothetical protein